MKHPSTLITTFALAFAALSPANLIAADALMEKRAKLTTPDAQAAFDAALDATAGPGTAAKLAAAEAAEAGSEHKELAKLCAKGEVSTKAAIKLIDWGKVPAQQKLDVAKSIAAKPKVTFEDATLLDRMPFTPCPELSARAQDILDAVPASDPKRYRLRYTKLQTPEPGGYQRSMKAWEVMAVSANPMTPLTYDTYRKQMLGQCVRMIKKKRAAEGLADDSKPTLEECVAPVVAALNAPLWEGLCEAMEPYDMPKLAAAKPDYTELVARLSKACDDYDKHLIGDVRPIAGSIMFWKGVDGYKAWKQSYQTK